VEDFYEHDNIASVSLIAEKLLISRVRIDLSSKKYHEVLNVLL
jgi:hypothetical protein